MNRAEIMLRLTQSPESARIRSELTQNSLRIRAEFALNLPRICSEYPQNILRISSEFAQNLLRVRLEFTQNSPGIHSEFAQSSLRIPSEFHLIRVWVEFDSIWFRFDAQKNPAQITLRLTETLESPRTHSEFTQYSHRILPQFTSGNESQSAQNSQ